MAPRALSNYLTEPDAGRHHDMVAPPSISSCREPQADASRSPVRRILGDVTQVLQKQIQEKLAYTRDRYGTVADPAAPGDLRDLMH